MSKMTFLFETGSLDSQGDVLKIEGVNIPSNIPLTKDFDRSNLIGTCKVFKEGNLLKIEAEIANELNDA
jgi:hypothetical protein